MFHDADTITLECGAATGSVCKGSRLKISCVAASAILRWSINTSELGFTMGSPIGVPTMKNDVIYTLLARYNDTAAERISLHSTAEFVAMKDTTISCADGENEKESCEVQLISEYTCIQR